MTVRKKKKYSTIPDDITDNFFIPYDGINVLRETWIFCRLFIILCCAPKLNNFIDEPVRDRSFENAIIRIHNWIREYSNFSPEHRSIEY